MSFPAEICVVQGKPYIFSNLRIDDSTVPNSLHIYDVRDDCDGEFWQVKKFVMVNHWATIIGVEPIDMERFEWVTRDGKKCVSEEYNCPPDFDDPCMSSEGWFVDDCVDSYGDYMARYDEIKANITN